MQAHGYVLYEDRPEAAVGAALALVSLLRSEPGAQVRLHVPPDWTELRAWAGGFPGVTLAEKMPAGVKGWSVKPFLLEAALADGGWRRVTWIDSDFVFLKGPGARLAALADDVLAVAQEPCLQPRQGTRWRAEAWGLEAGKEWGFTVNSCLVSVTSRHAGLLADWKAAVEAEAFRDAQALPILRRPAHLWSDQDALGALLGSKRYEALAVFVFRSGADIVHAGGLTFYSLKERWRTLTGPGPVVVHAIADKPWKVLARGGVAGGTFFWRLMALVQETGPYVYQARRYAGGLPMAAPWSKVFIRAERLATSRPVPKVRKSRMWMPMSPRTPFEPCAADRRQSQRSSVRQSPQCRPVSQLCR